jgi:hypothetical protein
MPVSCRKILILFLTLSLTVLVTAAVWGQGGTGELTGLVTDASGAVIANASYAVGTPCADAGCPDGFDAGRPNPNFSDFMLRTNCCDSNYNALQVTLRRRHTNALQFNANYTYAKVLDELSDAFTPSQDVNGGDAQALTGKERRP